MTDKKIKYSSELKAFLFELEANTDPDLWRRWEEKYPEILDWLWDQGFDPRKEAESEWQAIRVGFLKNALVERGFDRPEDRAILFQSKNENLTPLALRAKYYRWKRKIRGEMEWPSDTYAKWITHFNEVIDEHGEAIADFSLTELNFKETAEAPKRYW